MKTLTVYRATQAFMKKLNSEPGFLNLHRDRSEPFSKGQDNDATLIAINTMLNNGYLVPVATLTCDTLDDAYRLTNSIVRNWTENNEVTLLEGHEGFLSSTSVGDIFKAQDGTFTLVEACGFSTLIQQADGSLKRA